MKCSESSFPRSNFLVGFQVIFLDRLSWAISTGNSGNHVFFPSGRFPQPPQPQTQKPLPRSPSCWRVTRALSFELSPTSAVSHSSVVHAQLALGDCFLKWKSNMIHTTEQSSGDLFCFGWQKQVQVFLSVSDDSTWWRVPYSMEISRSKNGGTARY